MLEPGKRAVASVVFPRRSEVFVDHFPGQPVVPGVLLTEAMGQTGGWLIAATIGFERWPLLVMIERAKFRRLVRPDEELRLTARLTSTHGTTMAVDAEAACQDERVASARLVFHLVAFSHSDESREKFLTWAQRLFAELGGPALLRPP